MQNYTIFSQDCHERLHMLFTVQVQECHLESKYLRKSTHDKTTQTNKLKTKFRRMATSRWGGVGIR